MPKNVTLTNPMARKKKGWGIKRAAKGIVRSASNFIKNRYAPKSGFKLANVMSDVALLKSMINVEKKRWNYLPGSTGALSQVNVNASAHFVEDITPTLSQGTGEGNRIGNSIKISGIYGKIQLRNTNTQTAPVRFIVEVISVIGDPYTSMSTFISDYLMANAFISAYNAVSIYDWFSPRNPQNMKKFKRLCYKRVYMKPDSVTNQNQQTECTIKLKPNLHLKWEADANTTPNSGQLILLIRCDRGNYGGAASTLTGIVDTQAGSGYNVDRFFQHYLIDN